MNAYFSVWSFRTEAQPDSQPEPRLLARYCDLSPINYFRRGAEIRYDFADDLWMYGTYEALADERRLREQQEERAQAYHKKIRGVRQRVKENLAGNRLRWRYVVLGRGFLRTALRNKESGAALGLAVANYTKTGAYHHHHLAEIIDLLNEGMSRVLDCLPQNIQDEIGICEHCDDVVPRDSMGTVQTGVRTTEDWCGACRNDDAATCDDCGDLVISEDMVAVGRRLDVCARCYESNYFTCDACNQVYHNDDYGSDGCCLGCSELHEDEEDEDEDDGSVLNGYQQSCRDWVITHEKKGYPFEEAPALGMEIEVYSESRYDTVSALHEFSRGSEWGLPRLLLERDGSLDDDCGFEIITHPMGLYEWQTSGPLLVQELRRLNAVAWDATGGQYGIHLTVSRQFLSPLQEARLMMFLAAEPNDDFVMAMAQRVSIYNAALNIGQLGRPTISSVSPGGLNPKNRNGKYQKKMRGAGKYAPINFKDTLAEFRIFQSTLHPQSFMKDVEFILALIEWTNPMSATGSAWFYEDFLRWLQKRPMARKHYPSLIAYLERDRFPVKGLGSLPNMYKGFLPRQTLEVEQVRVEDEVVC